MELLIPTLSNSNTVVAINSYFTIVTVWLRHCDERRVFVWFSWQKESTYFIVSRPLTEMQLTIQALPIVMGKPIRNVYLVTVKYGWKYAVWQWGNRKHFLFGHSNIWNSKVAFYNKTTCLLRYVCFNRVLSVVTLVK